MRKKILATLVAGFVLSAAGLTFNLVMGETNVSAEMTDGVKTVWVDGNGNVYSSEAEGREAVTLKLSNYNGASIRYSAENPGIRFIGAIEKEGYESLGAAKANVTLGMLIGPSDLVGETLDFDDSSDNYQNVVLDKTQSWYQKTIENTEYYCYNAALTEIAQGNFDREFTAQSYMIIDYADETPDEYIYGAIPTDENGAMNVRSVSDVAKSIAEGAEFASLTKDQQYIVNSFNTENLSYKAAFGTVKGNDIDGYTLSPTSSMVAVADTVFTNGEVCVNVTPKKGGWPDFRMVFDTAVNGTSFSGGFTVSIVTQSVSGVDTVRLICQERGGDWTGYGSAYNICTYEEYRAAESRTFALCVQLSNTKINVFLNGVKVLDGVTLDRATASKLYCWSAGTQANLVEDISLKDITTSYKNTFGTTSGNDAFGYTISGTSAMTTVVDTLAENVEVSVKVKFNPAWHNFRIMFDTVAGDSFTGGFFVGIKRENDENVYVMTQMKDSPWTAWTKTKISTYAEFDFTKEYTLSFVLRGSSVTIYLDGVQIATATNVVRSTASKIYFWNATNAAVTVRDISVKYLTDAE